MEATAYNRARMEQQLRDAVSDTIGRADVRAAVQSIYEDLQGAIDVRRPVCNTSGRCCRFEEFGHRLYITTAELAVFLHTLVPPPDRNPDPGACPFQIDGLCSVHAIRPFGCRVFFCDETAQAWQEEQYTRFHAKLKQLHQDLGVPYLYVEWRQALAVLGLRPDSPASSPRSLPVLKGTE